jgi:large subunit ribosomal protein L18
MKISKAQSRKRIKNRIRKSLSGTSARPRLAVYRSNKAIYAQLIDDVSSMTLASASSKENSIAGSGTKSDQAKAVGSLLAEKAKAKKIETVVFDRGGYLYHGRVKALAEGAREGGLNF